ncbi:NADH-quinone oxidoreductase subunit E [Dyadobacter jejuensis]|uniref:NADH-quinone oxidoreductase subunit E n=1 Tax=Dyadobacter jejuensis TaxID=1082580 RepID=A0A316AS51_9BACT|nr:NADH-quinone oxidoreductase subunit NuoE [Dyadobacter jejuensis]PWJ60094.1 NADH-quinone oxidoreductase subunit E [Dyadobacter jejuensis]
MHIDSILSEQEIAAIEKEVAKLPMPKAACIEALKIVQQHRGWVSDDSLQLIAQHLQMSTAELDSVATFYNLIFRKPVGRHVILLCDSISCYVMGYEKIYEGLQRQLQIGFGETSPDGRFTLLPNACLGTCDHAPALMIDQDTYPDLKPEQLEAILNTYP